VSHIELQQWLINRMAHYLQQSPDEISPTDALIDQGINSSFALMLADDIEREFDLPVDPALAWDYPTIEAVVGYIADQLAVPNDPAGQV
jgi:acyl carrier protein